MDNIGESVDIFHKGIGVLKSDINHDVINLSLAGHNAMQPFFIAVEVAHKGGNTPLKVKCMLSGRVNPPINERNGDPPGDKGHLAKAMQEDIIIKAFHLSEDRFIVFEGNGRPALIFSASW